MTEILVFIGNHMAILWAGAGYAITGSQVSMVNAVSSAHGADFPRLDNAAEHVADAQQFLRTHPVEHGRLRRTNGDVSL